MNALCIENNDGFVKGKIYKASNKIDKLIINNTECNKESFLIITEEDIKKIINYYE